MKTIMLCLNQLGIGGVETAVLNQTIQLIKKNYRVVILARNGIYKKKMEEAGANVIEFEFVVENKFDSEKIKKVIEIINQYDVEQVHIHQFDCINVVFPACVLTKTPYVAYAHTGITGIYDWFERCYKGYNIMFKLYFESAYKIIAITESAKKENMEKYDIEPEKYIVIKNSIDFENFKTTNNEIPKKIEKFLIISRMSKEKITSIKNSIKVFRGYHEKNNKAKLTIVGDGECREEIEAEVEDIKDIVTFLGQKDNMAQIISQNDVVMAVDRCILETITMKKVAIISGYEELKGLVTPSNVEEASNSNFSGREFENKEAKEIIEELQKLNEEQINKIVEANYQYAFKNLNAKENIYLIQDCKDAKIEIESKYSINAIMELQNLYANNVEYTDKVYKECKETQEFLENKIEERDVEIKQKNIEIETKQKQIEELNKTLENMPSVRIKKKINKLFSKK